MKRFLCLLLTFCMLLPCLAGCSVELPDFINEFLSTIPEQKDNTPTGGFWDGLFGTEPAEDLCIADQPKEVTDPLLLSQDAQTALAEAVILSPGSPFAFARGERYDLGGLAPVYVEQILLIPALAVARLLGAECTENDDGICIALDGIRLTLIPGSDSILLGDGYNATLPMPIIPESGDLLVEMSTFCQALGQEQVMRDGLLLIGKHVLVTTADDSNGMTLVRSALQSEFTCTDPGITALGAVHTGDGYFARAERSECLVLTADMIPYTAENGETIAVAGGLYVEDLMIEPSSLRDDYYSCSMTVYNVGYTYGSIESFDQHDTLIEFQRIQPFEGQKASVTKAITDLAVLGADIYQAIDNRSWAELDYRSSLNSSKTTVRLEVPKDGYIFVTCNPLHSERVAVYNATHTFMTLISSAQDLMKSSGSNSAMELLTDYLAEQVLSNANAAMEVAMEFTKLLTDTASTPTNPADYAKKLGQGVLTMFQRCEFDIGGALKGAATDLGSDAIDNSVEAYMTKLLPALQVAFSAWNISFTSSNLICLFMDLAYCTKTRSVIIEIGDWRTAYADFLRQRGNQGYERYWIGYINGDGIPELMVLSYGAHFGPYTELYTYQKRQLVPIIREDGSNKLYVDFGDYNYMEFSSMLLVYGMSNGIVNTTYYSITDNTIHILHRFSNDIATNQNHYYYNGEQVPKFYHDIRLADLQSEYQDRTISVTGSSDGWSYDEAGIWEGLKR